MASGGMGGSVSAPARGGAFNGGNRAAFNGGDNMSFRENSRMGRMDHGHEHGREHGRDHDGRFRGPNFAFGFGYPDYYGSDYYYNNYDDGCYELREVPTRYGWRWRRVWVCD
jgi:hypothetical protein